MTVLLRLWPARRMTVLLWVWPARPRLQRNHRGRRWPADGALDPTDLERHPGTVGVGDVDAHPVTDVDRGYTALVDEHSIQAAVVDRRPPATLKAQQDVRP